MAAPIVIAFYVPYKLYYKTPFIRSFNMDLHSGIRELNLAELIREERAEQAEWPRWKKIYKFFC
jgi:yeast amino acid transporter